MTTKVPSPESRIFVAELNKLARENSSATFGDPGRMVVGKARRQLAFASAAWMRWPDLGDGDLRTTQVAEWHMSKVDQSCGFWAAGQQKYMAALAEYLDAFRSPNLDPATRTALLSDLGMHMVEDFVSEEEEEEMKAYWCPGGTVFAYGSKEQGSRRRFFNYGPVLPLATAGTTKSTLTVIPARLGAMPPLVSRQGLPSRILGEMRQRTGHSNNEREQILDQMYVNFYDASSKANIEFHHDNHTCMCGDIAGVSLLSNCEMQFRALDSNLLRPPLRILLPRRSLFLLSGLARWHLQHAIPEMYENRLSLTFRTVDKSCSREPSMWEQDWDCLEDEEARNAVWPLVLPGGEELHRIVSSPLEAILGDWRKVARAPRNEAANALVRAVRPTTVASNKLPSHCESQPPSHADNCGRGMARTSHVDIGNRTDVGMTVEQRLDVSGTHESGSVCGNEGRTESTSLISESERHVNPNPCRPVQRQQEFYSFAGKAHFEPTNNSPTPITSPSANVASKDDDCNTQKLPGFSYYSPLR